MAAAESGGGGVKPQEHYMEIIEMTGMLNKRIVEVNALFSISPVTFFQQKLHDIHRRLTDIIGKITSVYPHMLSVSKGSAILDILQTHRNRIASIFTSVTGANLSQGYVDFVNENKEISITIAEIRKSLGYIASKLKRDFLAQINDDDAINTRDIKTVNTRNMRWFEFEEQMKAIENAFMKEKVLMLSEKKSVLSPIVKEFRDFVFINYPGVLIYEEPLYVWLDNLYDQMEDMSESDLTKAAKLLYSYMGQINMINTQKTLSLMGGRRRKGKKLTRGRWRAGRRSGRKVTRRLR